MKKQIPLIALTVFSMVILLAQNNLPLAWAVSVSNVTFATGTTTTDVSYDKSTQGSDTSTAYIIGQNAGQAYAWKKSASTQAILFNVTLTGSGSARAIEYNPDNMFVYAVTNDKFYKLSTNLGIAGQLATGTANIVIQLFYDEINAILYYCTNDGYGTVNTSTLALTTLYTDGGVNGVFGCSFAIEDGFVFLTGDDIGSSADSLIGISLATHTQYDDVDLGVDFFYGNCADTEGNFVWALYPSAGVVRKYDMATLTQQASVTVGTTPRHCSINEDETGRRLYVANEGSNTVSIVDIDANTVLTSPAVCDTVAGRRIDTKRLFNTTNTFITCNSNVNSVIIDDTVSDFVPEPEAPNGNAVNGICGNGTVLECIGDRSVGLAITGGQDITVVSGDLFCGIGLNATCSGDVKENGTGILLMIITGTFFAGALIASIATANSKFGAGISFTEIPKEFWLFLVVSVVAFAFYMQWIPDILFYGLVVGLAGLFAFGLYRHIRG